LRHYDAAVKGRAVASWLALVTMLLVALGAGFAIVSLRQIADEQRQAVLTLSHIAEQSYRERALEWKIIGQRGFNGDDYEQIRSARALLVKDTGILGRLGVNTNLVKRVLTAHKHYQANADEELRLLASGRIAEALELHETGVDPNFDALIDALKAATEPMNESAVQAGRAADIGSVLALLIASITIAAISRRAESDRRTMLQLVAERSELLQRDERDPLTGLHNRAGLVRHHAACPPGLPVMLVMIDLNGLKAVNDREGHGAGDAYIKRASAALISASGPDATVARWGGDEFVLLLPGCDEERVQAITARAAAMIMGSQPGSAPFAFGVALTVSGEPLERAVAVADARMYDTKEEQRWASRGTSQINLGTLEEFTARLEGLLTPTEVIEVGISMARAHLGFDVSDYVERRGELFVLTSLSGFVSPEMRSKLGREEFRGGTGITGRAINEGISAWSNDYQNEEVALESWVELGIKCHIATPVYQAGQVVGVIGMFNVRTWRPITPQVRHVLEAVALRLGHALERIKAMDEVRRTLHGGLLTLGLALEARDLEVAGHTERVVDLSQALGCQLGLGEAALDALRQGAYLHDIGKLCVPDTILHKPGKLNAEEWTIMQTHAVRGHEIASRFPTLDSGALDVIRAHHERFDGTGYPDGLRGKKIPMLARIFAVCDVYDALLSARPYKPAWTQREALEEIRAQSGKHFDPMVVSSFIELISSFPVSTEVLDPITHFVQSAD
jgi:diguanylate cyclase (GGDEF)-like protein